MAQVITELETYLNRCCSDQHIEPFFLKVDIVHFLLIDDTFKLLIND